MPGVTHLQRMGGVRHRRLMRGRGSGTQGTCAFPGAISCEQSAFVRQGPVAEAHCRSRMQKNRLSDVINIRTEQAQARKPCAPRSQQGAPLSETARYPVGQCVAFRCRGSGVIGQHLWCRVVGMVSRCRQSTPCTHLTGAPLVAVLVMGIRREALNLSARERFRDAFCFKSINHRHRQLIGLQRRYRGVSTKERDIYLRWLHLIGMVGRASPSQSAAHGYSSAPEPDFPPPGPFWKECVSPDDKRPGGGVPRSGNGAMCLVPGCSFIVWRQDPSSRRASAVPLRDISDNKTCE